MGNPLLEQWVTPYEVPPFHLIKADHFKPAIEEAIKSAAEEISRITANTENPTFENTVAALEKCGEKLGRISSVLFNLNSAETSKELQAAAQETAPLLSRFSNDITLNEILFSRIKSVYDSKDTLGLSAEQMMLLENKYRSFLLEVLFWKVLTKLVSGKCRKSCHDYHLSLKKMFWMIQIPLNCA